MAKKAKVVLLYGGRSGEHEVSLLSAASVMKRLDRSQFDVVPVSIDKAGAWRRHDLQALESAMGSERSLPILKTDSASTNVLPALGSVVDHDLPTVVFPVMHGPLCEDGSLQGLLEQAGVAYVGPAVIGSAIGMDKDVAKRLMQAEGVSVVPWITIREGEWPRRKEEALAHIEKRLGGFPVFVKPPNMGSSVGVSKAKDAASLEAAVTEAFLYDKKVMIEKALAVREIEFSALENETLGGETLVSVAGEIMPTHEFYSYDAKYIDADGAAYKIPADISPELMKEGQRIARVAFRALELEGMSRVDLFLEKNSGRFFFNEVNTIPGFTQISMYPKMWEASGIPYTELLTKLVDLALARHKRRSALKREK